MKKNRLHKVTPGLVLQYIFIYGLALIVLLPVVNIFISAFKTNPEIMRSTILPANWNFDNFKKVFDQKIFYTGFLNSIIITAGSLALSTVLAALASYPLARSNRKFYTFLYLFFMSANMIPSVSNLIPLYSILRSLNLINTRLGMILIYASGLSMGILLFTSFYKTIPKELEEAAEIDGCTYLQRFFKVLFPLLKPISITYVMVNILGIWNDFLLPQVFLADRDKQPITLAVYTFSNEYGSDWGAIFALMSMAVLVPMILFITNQKYFFEGMTVGAVKG